MASFLTDLWCSIFTPGPTPTLLKATNASFAALQSVLFALLIATHSIHFVVLSILSGGLWWSINWFAIELLAVRAKEEVEKKRAEEREKEKEEGKRGKRRGVSAVDSGESETETESMAGGGEEEEEKEDGGIRSEPEVVLTAASDTPSASSLSSSPLASDSELKKRRSLADSSGYVSTDSEWEKVDEKDR